jgi:hypothetical protein
MHDHHFRTARIDCFLRHTPQAYRVAPHAHDKGEEIGRRGHGETDTHSCTQRVEMELSSRAQIAAFKGLGTHPEAQARHCTVMAMQHAWASALETHAAKRATANVKAPLLAAIMFTSLSSVCPKTRESCERGKVQFLSHQSVLECNDDEG